MSTMRTPLCLLLAVCFVWVLAGCRSTEPQPAEQDRVLTLLYWQAPSVPLPYLSSGYKDTDAAAPTLEPLASYDPDGALVPRLAEEIPTLGNGGLRADQRSITWRLRPGLKWSDGSDLTARDVVFTWRYCTDPETGCVSDSAFSGIESVRAPDELTVEVIFGAPTPYPYGAFVGASMPILSEAQFAGCIGLAARTCDEQNARPLGSGPYRIMEFTANEGAVYERNPHYRGEVPYFDRVLIRGGGDALSAAETVLEAGAADYAWNVQVEPESLIELEAAGRGKVVAAFASIVERIVINQTNPDPLLGDDRSEYLDGRNPHPFLTFTPIPQAMSLAIDRNEIAERLYGFAGTPVCNLVAAPPRYASTANDDCLVQDIEGARLLLDQSGVVDTDGDGIREYGSVPLRIRYQTTANAIREETQRLVREWWLEIGIASRPSSCSTMPQSSLEATPSRTREPRTAGSLQMCRCTRRDPISIRRGTFRASAVARSRRRRTTGPARTTRAPATSATRKSSRVSSNSRSERSGRRSFAS